MYLSEVSPINHETSWGAYRTEVVDWGFSTHFQEHEKVVTDSMEWWNKVRKKNIWTTQPSQLIQNWLAPRVKAVSASCQSFILTAESHRSSSSAASQTVSSVKMQVNSVVSVEGSASPQTDSSLFLREFSCRGSLSINKAFLSCLTSQWCVQYNCKVSGSGPVRVLFMTQYKCLLRAGEADRFKLRTNPLSRCAPTAQMHVDAKRAHPPTLTETFKIKSSQDSWVFS